jgi:transaldolase
MKASTALHALGQSLWLDNITRDLLNSGTLLRYIDMLSVTGLTSNPNIFDQAIRGTADYDAAIRQKIDDGKSGEGLFFELAIEDLKRAAALLHPVYAASGGVDGWVSLEVSPLLANDATATIEAAKRLHARADCPNLFIKIPGTPAGLYAIEEAIFSGVPVNVTLLFSSEQYLAAADAYWRGIERRIDANRDPRVNSVASIFISRWDKAIMKKVSPELRNRLGVAIAKRTYQAYCERLASPQWKKFADAGALTQRLLWASTGTKDPQILETYYVANLAAPNTINTMPEQTLNALDADGESFTAMPKDGGDAEDVLSDFVNAGVDVAALATQLQVEGAASFTKSWHDLMAVIDSKSH